MAITEGNSKVSGALYMAGEEHLQLLLDTYNLFSHTNPLHTEVWPSMRQMEADVIAMTAAMLGGDPRSVLNTFSPACNCNTYICVANTLSPAYSCMLKITTITMTITIVIIINIIISQGHELLVGSFQAC